jgi:hypothetical protein
VARLAIPVAVVGVLVAIRPEIVRGTFSSAQSMLKVGALIAVCMVFSRLMGRVIENPLARTAAVAVPFGVLLWFTVAPYFQEETVDDAFPVASGPAPTVAVPAAPGPTPTTPATTTTTTPAGPVKISTGQLRGLDGHRGSGEAALYRQLDGTFVVRLEDFDVSNTPGPVLYLVPGAGKDSPDGGTKLGPLRGSQGNQNFAVPSGVSTTGASTVLIWCEPFSVAVAGATQAPA